MINNRPLYVTLDTNIVVSNKFDFSETSSLSVLAKHVNSGKIKIVLSRIVIKEIEKHISQTSEQICKDLRKLRKEVLHRNSHSYLNQMGFDVFFPILDAELYKAKSLEIWNGFLEKLCPEILELNDIDIPKIVDDYFNLNPPFEDKKDKRKEFPDAFIADQIRRRFGEEQIIAIVSRDKGFKRACGNSSNYKFYDSLGELYDWLNKCEEEYGQVVENIESLIDNIIVDIEIRIKDGDYIEIHSLSYDKDGIISGVDYSDSEVVSVKNICCKVLTVDEITEEKVLATLLCSMDVEIMCSYEDYENGIWDPEEKEYIYLETKTDYQKHSATEELRVELNREENKMKILPFKIVLNSDTLDECIEDVETDNQELEWDDREEQGFYAFDKYKDYLEESLYSSPFMDSSANIFEKINAIYEEYEKIADVYYHLIDLIEKNKSKDLLVRLASIINDERICPACSESESITDEDVENILCWASESFDRISEFSQQKKLPETFTYGDAINIHTCEDNYKFIIEEFSAVPSEGDNIDIHLTVENSMGTIIGTGIVALSVGYIELNEDGGVENGMEDSIEYQCEELIDALKEILENMKKSVQTELDITKQIERILHEI